MQHGHGDRCAAPHRGLRISDGDPDARLWDRIDGAFALQAPYWFLFAQPAALVELLLSHDPVGYLDAVLAGMAEGLDRLDARALDDYHAAFARRSVREAIYSDYAAALGIGLDDERADQGRRH